MNKILDYLIKNKRIIGTYISLIILIFIGFFLYDSELFESVIQNIYFSEIEKWLLGGSLLAIIVTGVATGWISDFIYGFIFPSIDKKIKKNTDQLINDSGEIKGKLDILINKSQPLSTNINEKKNKSWFDKHKQFLITVLVILILIVSALIYNIYSTPFNMNVSLNYNKSTVHTLYPKLSDKAIVRFYFPSETKEKQITISNEIIINEIPSIFKNKKIKVQLIDDFWELTSDAIILKPDAVSLFMQPNDKLKIISGQVKDLLGNNLSEVNVYSQGLKAITDRQGRFVINVPLELRKPEYNLEVSKKGFILKNIEYLPGDDKEIRIQMKN